MAEERNTITIKFKPEGDKGLVSAIKALDNATKKLVSTQIGLQNGYVTFQKTTPKTNRLIDQLKTGIFTLGHSTRNTAGAFSVLRSKLLLFNFAMGLGIRQVLHFTKEASKVEDLERAFNTLSGGTEKATDALKELQEATNNTVSAVDLYQQANNAMILGVSKNSDEMAKMFDMAQRLGRALGRDTRSSIESFVTGVGRQSRLMLDNIGIIVKSEVAYKALADELKITTDELTEAQRKQAFLNATLVAGNKAIRDLGIEVLSSSDKFEQMNVQFFELRRELGEQLLPLVLKATESLNEFIKSLESEEVRKTISAVETLTVAFLTLAGAKTLGKVVLGIHAFGIALLKLNPLIRAITAVSAVLAVSGLGALTKKLYENIDATNEYNNALERLKNAQKDLERVQANQENYYKNLAKDIKDSKALIQAEANLKIESSKTEMIRLTQLVDSYDQSYDKIAETLKKDSEIRSIFNEVTKNFTDEEIQKNQEFFENLVAITFQKKKLYEEEAEAKEKAEIRKDRADEKSKREQEKRERDLKSFIDRVYGEDIDYQMARLKERSEYFAEIGATDTELDRFQNNERYNIVLSNLEKTNSLYNSFMAGYDQFVSSLTDMEMTGAERRKQIFEATKNAFVRFLGEMIKEKIKQIIVEKVISKAQSVGQVAQANVTSALIAQAYATPAFLASTATLGGASATGLSSLVAGITASKALAIPVAEEGGLVGGRRHSQGGTIIEAEKGEFIMSRKAVESIGVETLNQMNQNGTSGTTVNVTIQGGVVDDSYVNNTLIPALNKATSLGNKINA